MHAPLGRKKVVLTCVSNSRSIILYILKLQSYYFNRDIFNFKLKSTTADDFFKCLTVNWLNDFVPDYRCPSNKIYQRSFILILRKLTSLP